MKSNPLLLYAWAFLGSILLYTGCIAPKDSVTSRSMQNLTARYNIIYNANILLDESAVNIEKGTLDNYGQLLSVYKEPSETVSAGEATNLDSVIKKANTIVNDKLHSNYVNDAYLLIAKANFLKANFFNAAEFFTYVYDNYPEEKGSRQQSLTWKTRALLQLENFAEASNTIDTALKYIETSKKNIPEVYAAYAQFLIATKKETNAIPILEKALDAGSTKQNEIRWKYLLAQLQEKNKQYEQAYNNYSAVVKSNASFEMAFNANLNRIRIEDQENGKVVDRVARLKSLLKGDKNKDFTDQIYYQLGNIHFEKNEFDEAIQNYNTSIRKSTVNQNQKGLSYLRLADIYFDNADYVRAKTYYDSTVTALSPKYPGYDLIRKKSTNLELLASRYRTISHEDTLQALARLPEAQREARIGELVRLQADKSLAQINQQPATSNFLAGIDNPTTQLTEGKFYFNNTTAISQGFSDFKRRYGNRRLEDNWRRVAKTAAESTQTMSTDPDAPIDPSLSAVNQQNPETSRQDYLKNLPLTEPQLQQSNQKIAEAYYDIANFYKDELKDETTAIKTYEELVRHSPQSTYVLPTYYSLYLLHKGSNVEKSNSYRDLILSKYPDSPFAKAIRDPNYSREADEKEQALNNTYNTIFNLYTEKKYAAVLPAIQKAAQQFSNNKLSPQLDYLSALALGHTQKLPAFETALKQLAAAYPQDQLVTPLAKLHLQYIQENRAQMLARNTALLDYDPSEPFFVEEPIAQSQKPAQQVAQSTPVTNTVVQPNPTSSTQNSQSQIPSPATTPAVAPSASPSAASKSNTALNSQFSLPGAAEYYFVVNVTDYRINLSSSRFGIGQFNRTRYARKSLKHQLQDVGNENQLIYVGIFQNYEDVKAFESAIIPLLKDIMKVPAQQYTTFAITKESLEKLKTRQLVDAYIEFYKNSN